MRIERIVVGIDGSRNSDRAAAVAADLAELAGAEVVAVHAMGLLEDRPAPGQTVADRRAELRGEFEHAWCNLLRRTGTKVRCELRDGVATQALLSVADDVDADLIVVGTRGQGSPLARSLGSTSAAVVAATHRPVVVVPDSPDAD